MNTVIVRILSAAVGVCAGLGVLAGCQGSRTHAAIGEPARTPRSYTVSLPKGLSPTGVFTTTSASVVIKAAADAEYRSLYSWEPGKEPELIVEGRHLDVTRLSDDTFAAWYSENNQQALVTLNAQRIVSQPLILPQGGPTGWGACEGSVTSIVCIGDRPGMGIDDKDYDEMGFSAILTIDLMRQKTSWFSVKHQTRFRFDQARKTIYVSDFISPSSRSSVEAFDLAGKRRGAAQMSDMTASPSGHFAEPLQEDGSESWEIHEASSNKVLLAFNCGRPECKIGDRPDVNHWNPVFDDQVIVLRENTACDVYQISPTRLIKSIPCGGLPNYDWSRDGRELITLTYMGGEFRRESVNSP